MAALYDTFPHIESDRIVIRKMIENDAEALFEISNNDAVYRYIGPFLHRKSMSSLLTAIRNLGGRDFEKKKMIIAGIYLRAAPNRLVGLAEMFDYKKKTNTITMGYRINEAYWHQGIATEAIRLMVQYLVELGIDTIQAYVMPGNVYSSKALLKNGFTLANYTEQQKGWGGQAVVDAEVYVLSQSATE